MLLKVPTTQYLEDKLCIMTTLPILGLIQPKFSTMSHRVTNLANLPQTSMMILPGRS